MRPPGRPHCICITFPPCTARTRQPVWHGALRCCCSLDMALSRHDKGGPSPQCTTQPGVLWQHTPMSHLRCQPRTITTTWPRHQSRYYSSVQLSPTAVNQNKEQAVPQAGQQAGRHTSSPKLPLANSNAGSLQANPGAAWTICCYTPIVKVVVHGTQHTCPPHPTTTTAASTRESPMWPL